MGGALIGRVRGAAAHRLSECLLVVGTAGAAVAAGFFIQDFALNQLSPPMLLGTARSKANEWAWFAGFAVVALSGGLLWWRQHTVIRHLIFGAGVALAVLLSLPLMPIDGPDWGAGLTLAFVGLVWGALGLRDLIPPQDAALTLAPLGILGGIEMMAISANKGPVWAMWLGLAVSIALVALGSQLRKVQVLGISAAGIALFAFQLLDHYVGNSMVMPVALIVGGFVLLGVGAWLLLREVPAEKKAQKVVAELAGYVGTGLAVAGGGMLVGEFGDELGVAGRIVVPAVGAVAGYAVGLVLDRRESGSARRLSQVLLGIGAIAIGFTAAMVAKPFADSYFPSARVVQFDYAASWTLLAGTVGATIAGALTWWFKRGSITQIVFGSAVFALIAAANGLRPMSPPAIAGAATFIVGLAWLGLGIAGRMKPERTAIAFGSLEVLFGLQMMMRGPMGEPYTWVMILAILVAIAMVVASILLKQGILLGFGAVGVVLFTFTWIMESFAGQIGAPIALLIAGVIFIAMAVVVAVFLPRMRKKTPGPGPGGAVPAG